jgi:hypothetical protein
MVKGDAKTHIAKDVQIHPRTFTRSKPFIAKWVVRNIKTKDPTFIAINSLRVKI